MSWSLIDGRGARKYLTRSERAAFLEAAQAAPEPRRSLCLTIALTGARISEVLALTVDRVDASAGVLVFETLKRRRRGIFRLVPVPEELVEILLNLDGIEAGQKIWTMSRPTAWRYVKATLELAGVPAHLTKPRALRHTFGVEAVRNKIALSLVRKWLGHSKIETTAIYADPVGQEERELASLMWQEDSWRRGRSIKIRL